jgi:hypothetical protein
MGISPGSSTRPEVSPPCRRAMEVVDQADGDFFQPLGATEREQLD